MAKKSHWMDTFRIARKKDKSITDWEALRGEKRTLTLAKNARLLKNTGKL